MGKGPGRLGPSNLASWDLDLLTRGAPNGLTIEELGMLRMLDPDRIRPISSSVLDVYPGLNPPASVPALTYARTCHMP